MCSCVRLCICLFVHVFVSFVRVFVSSFVHLFACSFVHLFVCLFVCSSFLSCFLSDAVVRQQGVLHLKVFFFRGGGVSPPRFLLFSTAHIQHRQCSETIVKLHFVFYYFVLFHVLSILTLQGTRYVAAACDSHTCGKEVRVVCITFVAFL